MKKYYLGVDIGGTEIKFGFFDENKILLDSFKVKTPTENIKEELTKVIFDNAIKKLDDQEASLNSLEGIGIAIPGPVKNGIITYCANIDLGYNFDITKAIKDQFHKQSLKVVVGNDADLAALGEYKTFNRKDVKDIVFITLGTGIGGGVIINDKLVQGSSGSGGEIGHTIYDLKNGRKCGCGAIGCVETVAGTNGMIQTANELMKNERSIMKDKTITPKLIFDSAKEGDLVALKVADSVAEAIGYMAANISAIIDPSVFIIGGGVSKAGQYLISKINYHYKRLARFGTSDARFEMAKLGNDAGFYGAFYLLFEN